MSDLDASELSLEELQNRSFGKSVGFSGQTLVKCSAVEYTSPEGQSINCFLVLLSECIIIVAPPTEEGFEVLEKFRLNSFKKVEIDPSDSRRMALTIRAEEFEFALLDDASTADWAAALNEAAHDVKTNFRAVVLTDAAPPSPNTSEGRGGGPPAGHMWGKRMAAPPPRKKGGPPRQTPPKMLPNVGVRAAASANTPPTTQVDMPALSPAEPVKKESEATPEIAEGGRRSSRMFLNALGEKSSNLLVPKQPTDGSLSPNKRDTPVLTKEDSFSSAKVSLLQELIDSERTYIDELEVLDKYFRLPLQQSGMVDANHMSVLFSNLSILINAHRDLLHEFDFMMRRMGALGVEFNIGATLMKLPEFLKVYTTYNNNHHDQLDTAHSLMGNKEMQKVIKQHANAPELKGATFVSLLVKPSQRIYTYKEFLKRFLEIEAQGSNSEEMKFIRTAQDNLKNVVAKMEESKEKAENVRKIVEAAANMQDSEKLCLLSNPNRKHVKQDVMLEESEIYEGQQEILYILFSDILLRGERVKDKKKAKKKDSDKARPEWRLSSRHNNATLTYSRHADPTSCVFELFCTDGSHFRCTAPSHAQQQDWIQSLQFAGVKYRT